MKKKETIDSLLKLLAEEAKKLKKKKKKFSPVAIAPIRRPMGSIFYMDAGVSMNESINESRSIIKPITKKFDHLKWQLNDFQKQFLDDFISVPDEQLKEKDFEYASKRIGIPLANIKSIKNTHAEKKTTEEIHRENVRIQRELGMGGGMLDEKTLEDANSEFTNVRDLPKDKAGKSWSMNPNPEFRSKSLGQINYEDSLAAEAGGGLNRMHERELPKFMYEWLLYFLEGSTKFKITESKLMNDFHSNKFDNYKFILFSIDSLMKESGAHPYDMASNTRITETKEIEEKLREFNEMFGTNFIVGNQYTGTDGFLKVIMENAQVTDGKRIYNRKFIDMNDTDILKAMRLGYYGQSTTVRSIT